MQLSILIVNWNSKDHLRKCLESIRATCSDESPQVVVVDGGSFDGSAELVAREFPEVEFVQSAENIGFGRSNNLGFLRVKGEAVLLLNPDTELRPHAVKVLLDALIQESRSGIIGARLLNTDGTLQLSSIHQLPTPLNCALDSDWLRRRWWAKSGPPDHGEAVPVEAVSGACMMMRSEVFRKLGGFSPQYFMYAEDMDLCLKITRAGFNIYHAPDAVVVHHGGGSSSAQFSKFSSIMIREALHVYMRTNYGLEGVIHFKVLIGVSAAARLILLLPLWIMAAGNWRKNWEVSVKKWWVVLRWALGMEKWARPYFCVPDEGAPGSSLINTKRVIDNNNLKVGT